MNCSSTLRFKKVTFLKNDLEWEKTENSTPEMKV